ncbi:MAG: Gfo/Idh/MocA family oxidoreductase [Niabella sp.]
MNKIFNTAIASFGMSGKLFHAPFLKASPHFKLWGILERHRDESRAKYPDTKLYRSFDELLADKEVDVVVVNTPVQTHFEYAKAALNAGKSVIVEKPFTVNANEALELDLLAKEKDLFLSVYQNRRYDGDFLAVRDVVTENLLGELREAEFRFDRYRPFAGGKDHKEGGLPGSGSLHDLGAHLIDGAIQLFGYPQAVFADILTMRKDTIANDYFELLLFYPRPFRVRLKASLFVREPYYSYILQGENGSFLQQRSDLQEDRLLQGIEPSVNSWISTPEGFDGILHTTINGQEVHRETRSEIGNYMNYYEAVYQALLGKQENPVPAAQAVLTMRIIDAAFLSDREKRVVVLE